MNHGLARGISFQLRRTALRACAAAFFFFAAPLSAQQEDDLLIRRSLVTGHASFVTARNGEAIFTSNVAGQTTAMGFLQTYGALFGVNDALGELQFDSAEIDALGHTRTTYLQVHQGIEVFSGVLRVHQNAQGQVIAANGDFYPVALKFPPTPTLKPDEALQIALGELGTTGAAVERRTLVLVDPGWYGDPPRGMRLAYYLILNNQLAPLVQVGVAQPLREAFFIDAHSGAVLDRWSLVYDAKNRRVYDAQAGSDCCFRHEDPGCDDTDCEALVCAAWAACCEEGWTNICGARAAQLCGTMCLPGTLVRAEGDPATGEVGVDALYDYLGDTYDFFLRAYGRDGFNDEGEAIVATVNSLAIGCPNAAWFGGLRQMLFCSDTTSDDIIAHEFMHAVTQETANLIYQNQSGQLNESYSDVFGELIDLFNGDVSGLGPPTGTPWPAHPSGSGLDEPNLERSTCSDPLVGYSDGIRWLIGEDAIGFGNAIRDMWDPTCLGDPDRANSPLQTCSIIDGGGVHSGSGIPNHAFALLTDGGSFNGVDVEGIGATKSAAVWFRALTTYLSIASDFDETYAALSQSALDLIGVAVNDPRTGLPIPSVFTTHDATQVDRALRAVEMDTPGRCGASVDVLDEAPAPTCADSVTLFADDMEGDLSGWSVSHEG